uniref:Uncharacterized protein n=1 Tax=Candidatus Kentrum sp. SD TaxID=2126332 RepID=A0A450Y7R2_9GAMM|nr:MAG: hypothetical protein BECKSD772F_GA0070984_10174 [Candidatus Kentron sp. SD]VFK44704.1 MAG: hypothetical protein BECKSD772F_GA0070984_11924 [Candidatus Kentron sp. SD]VFK48952.1 MAG: hypothetical protein BECKSD772E_GA0070983_11515 [Candidatus Kentron sp. SD]
MFQIELLPKMTREEKIRHLPRGLFVEERSPLTGYKATFFVYRKNKKPERFGAPAKAPPDGSSEAPTCPSVDFI